jgi:hypothetical protein
LISVNNCENCQIILISTIYYLLSTSLIKLKTKYHKMKKHLLKGLALVASMIAMEASAQNRYIDPVFAGVNKTANIMYDSNASINILYGQIPGIQPLFSHKLKCDVYEPTGDTEVKRPLVILAHTGSYLPAVVNKQTTGNKNDSTIVEIATQLARRGYVVAAIEYRSGWNPLTTNQSSATEQLLKATYRGLQDVKNAARFFRANAATYKIDTSKIIMGGQGTGGYIAYAVGTVNTRADIESNLKFLRGDATPMVNMDTLGDWTGLGGFAPLNYGADANVSSDIDMVFNYGGAMGDTAWMKANSLPMVSLQCTRDPFAPYLTGNVIVPTTGITVIPNASGAGHVIPKANKMGLNNKLNSVGYTDAVSARALVSAKGENNLFGMESSFPLENSPWEWWSRPILQGTTVVPYAGSPAGPPTYGFIPGNGREADSLSFLTNPTMSAAKAKAYCDTIVKFVSPRIAIQFDIAGTATLNAFSLLGPKSGDSLDLRAADSTSFLVAKWGKSHVTGAAAGSTIYTFELDMAMGNFSNPLYAVPVPDGDSLAMAKSFLFNAMPTGIDVTLPLKWRIVASNDHYSKVSSQENFVFLTKRGAVGVSETDLNAYVSLFPNPAKEQITITLDNSKAPMSKLVVIDLMGREVASVNNIAANNYSLNTGSFVPGVYFVNITNQNGDIATKRFIIK